jgi:hypothetical protein
MSVFFIALGAFFLGHWMGGYLAIRSIQKRNPAMAAYLFNEKAALHTQIAISDEGLEPGDICVWNPQTGRVSKAKVNFVQ